MADASSGINQGLACLQLLCRFYRISFDEEAARHEYGAADEGTQLSALVRAARKAGFRARPGRLNWERLSFQPCPAICRDNDGGWVILARFGIVPGRDGSVGLLQWPDGRQETLDLAGLKERLQGEIVALSPRAEAEADALRFDLAWFVPMLVRHRWRVFEMLLAAFVVNLLGLATPIGFQVVMDKVLVHRAFETLFTIGVGLALAVVMESVLSTLRGYFAAHLGCRMDARLGASVFRRLVRQPLEFFSNRQVGEIVQRVREIESVRAFLVNGVVNVVLDLAFMVVYLWVMWFYSPFLTKVVLASLLAYSAIAVVMGPVIRRRVRRQYERQAANQGYMVETVKAIRTLKSSALEPSKEEGWGRRLADYSNSSFSAALAGNYGSNAVQLVSKLTTVALLALGALEVIDGRLTVGALVAFNMLSQRVSQPVLRLAQLWQELQEVRVALKRLSDLMESPTEDANTGTAPSVALQGRVEFDRVGFRYPNRDREALRDVSFSVEPGQVVGVVGRSGSGKSTLVALLQRFYHPTTGRILVDGHNLSGLRPSWLRRQMGVVLQDNELFDGTVADNIALTDPSMPFSAVEAAARLACAHGFITDELGNGYQTMVGEGGSQLSGGQRQRVAIARALAGDPRILILDEATSALDSESAAEFRANLPQICQGRTAFIVTHNLAMLANCDLVLVIEGGTVIERGTPDELAAAGGRFATLQRTGKL